MNLILLGAPGAGKGTLASYLIEQMGVPSISTGNILREAIKNNTPLGQSAKEYMDELDYDAYASFREPFVDDDKAEYVGISFIKLPSEKIESQNAWIVYNLMSKERVMIISNWDAVDGSEGTVSVTTEKIGDNTYAFAVIRTPGRDPDEGEDGGSIHL